MQKKNSKWTFGRWNAGWPGNHGHLAGKLRRDISPNVWFMKAVD